MTWRGLAAVGYQFDPRAMWKLFQFGAAVAQSRCEDVNEVLGWSLPADSANGRADEATLRQALSELHAQIQARGCFELKDELQTCDEVRFAP